MTKKRSLAAAARAAYAGAMAAFGERVRELREARGMTLRIAAQRAETTPQSWSDIERGRRGNPRLTTIFAMARALDVTVLELLAGVDDPRELAD